MARPYDLTKFKKKLAKELPNVSYGFNDPTTWINTGCFALNYLISNRFDGGIPLEGKMTMFAGDSGSGKSYIATANSIRWCQKNGVWPVLIDTENALDKAWLDAIEDIDTTENGMDKVSAATVDDVALLLYGLIEDYKTAFSAKPFEERPKMVFIIDSIGMLITPNQERQVSEGDMKGDLGLKAKQITHMLRVIMAKIAAEPMGLIVTNHVFDAQDKYKPDAIPGGKMLEFATSIIVQMNKYMLKEDEDGNKLTDGAVAGIRTSAVVRKSRYAKPFERLKIDIPYDRGMDPYSGLFDLFELKGVIQKDGARYTYTSPETGEIFKEYRKNFKKARILDEIMKEWHLWEGPGAKLGFDDTEGATVDGSGGEE